ncbi:hypothetical protein CO112_02360 [Candidatus Dojkabacteria bacterium CG_4_9_14_3_um_filter_150_Dojkabacteria_WS6_41_13]|nr:MAG: hypothetical protein COZ14_02060 [Candidatus Dojkabacteria bacterium CG_4_10_14_3_um_filter_Dojkabacteria_WS6_41_9]PJB22818.1 MAG: hypothetical protein CO112_02360 [Candidatus Dojkabacteria bacterium CG_4_9_14_3_um_filter_150_Dojkabacteria_WS6_41_13]
MIRCSMQAQPRNDQITGFTLVELLVVIVIMGILLMLTSGMSQRTRNTFTAQQYIKTVVQDARILRRKSMLISRSSSQSGQWVYGIGFQVKKVNNQWQIEAVQAIDVSGGTSNFYKTYPDASLPLPGSIEIAPLADSTIQKLPEYMTLQIEDHATATIETCDDATSVLTVIYESINGNLHVYCSKAGGVDLPTTSNIKDHNIKISISYDSANAEKYNYYLNLKGNGEINAVRN